MSFQAYLDNIEAKTGLTPRQFIALADERGFGPETKVTPIVAWLKQDYGLGHGIRRSGSQAQASRRGGCSRLRV